MDQRVARQIARANHRGQRSRFGDSVIEHLTHVAEAVAPEARAVAWLYDLPELTSLDTEQLRAQGLTMVQESTLALLTREPGAPYEHYIVRIARATGRAGQMARMVKVADLDDHLAHGWVPPGAPPYAWARRRVCERLPPPPALVS
jgi:hypothetical protein